MELQSGLTSPVEVEISQEELAKLLKIRPLLRGSKLPEIFPGEEPYVGEDELLEKIHQLLFQREATEKGENPHNYECKDELGPLPEKLVKPLFGEHPEDIKTPVYEIDREWPEHTLLPRVKKGMVRLWRVKGAEKEGELLRLIQDRGFSLSLKDPLFLSRDREGKLVLDPTKIANWLKEEANFYHTIRQEREAARYDSLHNMVTSE